MQPIIAIIVEMPIPVVEAFPEAEDYLDYVRRRLVERYPGAQVVVAPSARTRVAVHAGPSLAHYDSAIIGDEIVEEIRHTLWADYRRDGYREYSVTCFDKTPVAGI
jgi:hypothetical protein